MATKEKACRECKTIIEEEKPVKCPNCGSTNLTSFWQGIVYVVQPENSEIAKKLGITKKGKYAIRLSK